MPDILSTTPVLVMWGVIGYLLGSIPFGVVLARLFSLGDLRKIGSGNIGATNVLRTGNKTAAVLTVLLDGAKGAVAVLLARIMAGEDAAQLAGLMSFLGHCFPIWLKFRGGKGVATFFGIILALAWPAGIACCVTWLFAAVASRISSLAAIYSAALSTIWLVLVGHKEAIFLGLALTFLVFARHWQNIIRIKKGTEPKIGES